MAEDTPKPWLASYPEDVPEEVDVAPYPSLCHMFSAVCTEFGRRAAFVSFGYSVSYRRLETYVSRFAAFLSGHCGLKRGDRVAIIMPNLIQYPVAVFAVLQAGLTVVNLNPLYTRREMLDVLKISKAKAVVAFDACAKDLLAVQSETEVAWVIVTSAGDLLDPLRRLVVNYVTRHVRHMVPPYDKSRVIMMRQALKIGEDIKPPESVSGLGDTAFLQFTGGTTGRPKGAMLTHGNILANVAQLLGMYGMILRRGGEIMLTALPLYHIFAMTINLILGVNIACKNILIPDPRRMRDVEKVMLNNRNLSVITGVNTLFNALLNNGVLMRVRLPYLRLAVGGGAAIQTGVAERFYNVTGVHILEGYGLTECSPVTCVNPHTNRIFNGSIGLPLPSTLARIVGQDGNEIRQIGVPGELEFRGPQVMAGYDGSPEDNAAVFDHGWLRTGDIAVWQEGGYLRIIDRIKDMILVSGFNVYPSEIEDVVSQNDRVAECACVGIPSESTGESIKLFVVRRDPDLTEDEVKAFCRRYLTGYKMPKVIEFVSSLPKSAVGKVLRRCLKQGGGKS